MTVTVTIYTYDGLGRLKSEAETGTPAVSYTYDDANNRKTLTVANTSQTTYTYDRNNRLLTEVKQEGSSTLTTHYSYDNNGNQISSGVSLNQYDGFNQLIQVQSGAITASYTYNGQGLRTGKTVNGTTQKHVWDGQNMVLELRGGTVVNKYIRGINLIYSQLEGNTEKVYYLYNGHGDVVQLTNGSGAVTKSYAYDAFGNEKNPDANDANVFRYSGEYFDKETGTIYLRARYYAPGIGRFLSEDTYTGKATDPLSLNLYTYCANNPVIFVDPSGNAWYHWAIAGGIVVVAAVAVVVTAGGALPAVMAVASVANGVAAASTATTVAAGAFIGSSTALGGTALYAAASSNSMDDFNEQGNWGTVAFTAGGAALGGAAGYGMKPKIPKDTGNGAGSSIPKVNTPSASTRVINAPEVKSPNSIKSSQVTQRWDDYLGPNTTNINPRTGQVDLNRIFSTDGTRSVRFDSHEMNSIGTPKFHYHEETWIYDAINDIMTVLNTLQRIK